MLVLLYLQLQLLPGPDHLRLLNRHTSAAVWFEMILFLLLVAETALGCDLRYTDDQIMIHQSDLIDTESWSPPSTEDMECKRGYSNCWASGTLQDRCTNEYSFIGCTRYSFSVLGPDYHSSPAETGLVINDNFIVRKHEKNFDEALWNDILTPSNGCALQYRVIACDYITSNCSGYDIDIDPSFVLKTSEEAQDCHGYYMNVLVLDSNEPRSNHETPNVPAKEDVRTSSRKPTLASMTVAWTTTVANKSCIAAYNVCWKKEHATYVGCQRAQNITDFETPGRFHSYQYKVRVHALPRDAIEPDEITPIPISDSGAPRQLYNSLIAITTMFCLLILFTTTKR